MQDHLLFIDTETSGLPKDWTQPYANDANWPHAVQVSWIIYTRSGVEIKREDHFIRDNDFAIDKSAFKIHGITRSFLNKNGKPRREVMTKLYMDLVNYQPLVVGHYIELDYNITGVDFYRLGVENPMDNLEQYCTMLGSKQYSRNPQVTHLRLGQLYSLLFNKPLLNQHNSLIDAEATAECFFEMLRTNTVDDAAIDRQRLEREQSKLPVLEKGCGLPFVIFFYLPL